MLLSILIRNYNEAANLEKTLLLLQKQQLPTPYEIVVSDNESTDNSVAVAQSFGCRVVTNKRGTFSYGQLLNYGISHCRGQYVLLLSAHVAVIGSQSVVNGLAHLLADEQIAFVSGMPANQVGLMLDGLQPKIFTQSDFKTDTDWQRAEFYLLGAPCGIIRKSVWEQVKFDEMLEFAEDRYWSRCTIEAGYKGYFGADMFFFYFKQKTARANRQRLYAQSLAHYRLYGKPESSGLYARTLKTATANVLHAIAAWPRQLLLILKIRLIQQQKRIPPVSGKPQHPDNPDT